MDIEETEHASRVIEQRNISRDWIQNTLDEPERKEPDEDDPELEHRLRRVEEYGNRVLRVIINKEVDPARLVTAYFDRTMKGRL